MAGQRDHLGDVHALVAHALDVLDDVEQRRDDTQVGGHRRLGRQQRQNSLVHLEVAAVDAIVVGDHHRRQLDVLLLEGLERAVQRVDDHVEAPEGLLLQLLKMLLELRPRFSHADGLPELP